MLLAFGQAVGVWLVGCVIRHVAGQLNSKHMHVCASPAGVLLLCAGGMGSIEGQGRVRLRCSAWWKQSAVCGVLCRPRARAEE